MPDSYSVCKFIHLFPCVTSIVGQQNSKDIDQHWICLLYTSMDKQRLVQLLQQKGAVVAVTGDGTNDAPALNHAQVGLSMGTGRCV